MPLDDRKRIILQAVVEDYINTAEPVGSRSISKKSDLNLSAATIRNEMGDLEEMGLLVQPHTSAGRVPSTLGYRLYVDDLMQKYEITAGEIEKMQSAVDLKVRELDKIVRSVSAAFSSITGLPVIGVLPTAESGMVKNIKLVAVDDMTVMVIISDRSGIIKNKLLRLKEHISDDFIVRLNDVLNENLAGLTVSEINFKNIMKVHSAVGGSMDILSAVLELVHDAVSEIDKKQIFVEGLSNIFSFPEYSNIDKVKEIFSAMENKENLTKIISYLTADGIKVMIGDEIPVQELKNNSVILSPYRVSEKLKGVIGVIGPARMDYAKVISVLEYFAKQLSDVLNEKFGNRKSMGQLLLEAATSDAEGSTNAVSANQEGEITDEE